MASSLAWAQLLFSLWLQIPEENSSQKEGTYRSSQSQGPL